MNEGYYHVTLTLLLLLVTTTGCHGDNNAARNGSDSCSLSTNKPSYKDAGNSSYGDWFKPVRGFVHLLSSSDIPIDEIMELIQEAKDGNKPTNDKITQVVKDILKVEGGLLFFTAFGLLMFIIMFIAAPFACCCFTCGCCCKATVEAPNKTSHKNRKIMYFFLGLFQVVVLIGLLSMFASSNIIKQSPNNIKERIIVNVDNANEFLDFTVNQVKDFTVSNYDILTDSIKNTLQDRGNELGVPIRDELTEKAEKAKKDFVDTQKKVNTIQISAELIEKLYVTIKEFGTGKKSLCDSATAAAAAADCNLAFNTLSELATPTDFQTVQLNTAVDQMNNIVEKVEESVQQVQDIPITLVEKTEGVVGEVLTTLANFRGTVIDFTSEFDSITNNVGNITTTVKTGVQDAFDAPGVKGTTDYSYMFFTVIACIILAIWILLLLGLFCGPIVYDKHKMPNERSCGSQASGCFLITALFLMYLTSSLLWLISTIMFTVGAHVEAYICQPLYDEPDFIVLEKILAATAKANGIEGNYLGHVLLKNSSIEIKVADILENLKKDTPAYEALYIENMFNIDEAFDYSNKLNVRPSLGDLFVLLKDNVQLLPEDLLKDLGELPSFSSLEFDKLDQALKPDELKTAKTQLETIKTAVACPGSSPPDCIEIENFITNIGNVDKNWANIEKYIKDLQASKALFTKTKETLKQVFDTFVNSSATKTEEFSDKIIFHIEDFLECAKTTVKTKMAGTRPLWDLFDGVRGGACKDITDPLNGFWFGLGLSLTTFIPLMCFVPKLSRHFRKWSNYRGSHDYLLGSERDDELQERCPPPYSKR